MTVGVYGSAQGDSRDNYQIGQNNNRLAYRFRASTTSAATGIRVSQRGLGGGNSYSGGNGGTIRISIQTDNGGVPSGIILASTTFSPGNPSGNWEVWPLETFPTPATLTAGQMYEIVFDNVDPAPNTNWISLNALWTAGPALTPRQPTFSNDYAVLYASPTTWVLKTGDTPIMDLAYANGIHDGMNYIGAMEANYGSISGPSNLVREHFTVSGGDRMVTSASVKVKRISGTSPLTIRLEKDDGTLIEAVDIPSGSIGLGSLPTVDNSGNTWAVATFLAPHVLVNGATYNLVLSSPADTQYVAVPVQEGTTKGMLSRAFTDGDGQKTSNGGSTWAYLYPYLDNGRQDLQFFLR